MSSLAGVSRSAQGWQTARYARDHIHQQLPKPSAAWQANRDPRPPPLTRIRGQSTHINHDSYPLQHAKQKDHRELLWG